MKLLLTSTGLSSPVIKDAFFQLVGKNAKDITIAFIPTAADPEADKWFVQAAIDEVKDMGMQLSTVDLKEENKESLYQKLALCDVIYVNGGNTVYLLNWVRKSGFNKVFPDLVSQGKVYLGSSAGSMIVGPSIRHIGSENSISLQDMTGINLVPFAIEPHFTEAGRKVLENSMKAFGYQIIPITDEQAIVVEENKITIIPYFLAANPL